MPTSSLTGPSPVVHIPNGEIGVEYREVGGFLGYAVGADGSVWSRRVTGRRRIGSVWRRLAFGAHPQGYSIVSLGPWEGRRVTFYVHVLVLTAFVGPCPDGLEARHFPDRSPANCRLDNLSWATPDTNAADRVVHGTQICGETVWTCKLTEPQVRQIIRRLHQGESAAAIAADIGASYQSVRLIAYGKTWKHVPRE